MFDNAVRGILSVTGVGMLALGLASGCAEVNAEVSNRPDSDQEQFDFVAHEGELSSTEIDEALSSEPDFATFTEVENLATVQAPSGTLHYLRYVDRDPSREPSVKYCDAVASEAVVASSCGISAFETPASISLGGGSYDEVWRSQVMLVNDQATEVKAVADDGTEFSCTPHAGFCLFEWKTEHGDLVATAYAADGQSLGSVDITQ